MKRSQKNQIPSLSPTRSLVVLQETDEMRHPYETALNPLGLQIAWCHSYKQLVDLYAQNETDLIVVDLDCLKQPIDTEIENLRAHFPATELIALSSTDSAQFALQCIRTGFTDFLLKPASPEELAHSVRKAQQRHELIERIDDPNVEFVRAITQISGCATPMLVRLYTLEYLQLIFKAEGAAWLAIDPRGPEHSKVLGSLPKRMETSRIVFDLPFEKIVFDPPKPLVVKSRDKVSRKVVLPCRNFPKNALFLWGIKARVPSHTVQSSLLLLEHAEISLLNIQKFEEVKHQTFVDDLTGLYNSRYLKYALTNSILRCKMPNECFSLLFIDVDHFKAINDKHSHLVGSEFLITIGKTIKNAVRRIDPVFRYGGDEFVVILNGAGVEGAKEIAERIRKNIERRLYVIRDQRIQTTVSIGIATYPEHASDRDTLLRMADEAMYEAKRETRNAVHLASPVAKIPSEELA